MAVAPIELKSLVLLAPDASIPARGCTLGRDQEQHQMTHAAKLDDVQLALQHASISQRCTNVVSSDRGATLPSPINPADPQTYPSNANVPAVDKSQVNGPGSSHHDVNEAPGKLYPLYRFALDNFQRPSPPDTLVSILRRRSVGSLNIKSKESLTICARLRWEHSMLVTPLTKLQGEQAKLAVQAFRNISGFMGNRSSGKGQVDHCFKLLRNVMPQPAAVKDEVFCQLVKQLTANPDRNAVLNGWLLLRACLVTFAPSPTLSPYLEQFLRIRASTHDNPVVAFATKCLASIHLWRATTTERKEIPGVHEIDALRNHFDMTVVVALIDGSTISVSIDSWTTCRALEERIARHLHLKRPEMYALFETEPVAPTVPPALVPVINRESRLDQDERVLDMFALWERIDAERKLPKPKKKDKYSLANTHGVFRTHGLLYTVYLHLPFEDDWGADLHIVYLQAVHDITSASLSCSLADSVALAAYQLCFIAGKNRTDGGHTERSSPLPARDGANNTVSGAGAGRDAFSDDDIVACLPWILVSTSDRQELVIQVRYAYERVHKDELSIEGAKHAYLHICRSLKSYGCMCFTVRNPRDRSLPTELVLAIDNNGIKLLSPDDRAVVRELPYATIVSWGYSTHSFVFAADTSSVLASTSIQALNRLGQIEYAFKTQQGKAINDVIAAYVAFLLANQPHSQHKPSKIS